jgi:Tfp pilus assembly major pilin PilA
MGGYGGFGDILIVWRTNIIMSKNNFNIMLSSPDLIYNPSIDTSQMENVLLIDSSVKDYQNIVHSVNSNTFTVVYSVTSRKTDILALLQNKFTSIKRLALCFESSLQQYKTFLDLEYLFDSSDVITPYNGNVSFMIEIIRQFSIQNLDFLACKTLNYANWVEYYALLTKETGVIIGASNNETGNMRYGGDWVMENTCQNVESIYFTYSIRYYEYVLDKSGWVTALKQSTPLKQPSAMATYGDYLYNANVIDSCHNNITKIHLPDGYVTNPYWSDISSVSNTSALILSGMTIDDSGNYMYVVNATNISTNNLPHTSNIYKIKMSDGKISKDVSFNYYLFDIKWYQNYLYVTANTDNSGSYILKVDSSLNIVQRSYAITYNGGFKPNLYSLFINSNKLYATEWTQTTIFKLDLSNFTNSNFIVNPYWNNYQSLYLGMCLSGNSLITCKSVDSNYGYGSISSMNLTDGTIIDANINNYSNILTLPYGIIKYQNFYYVSNFASNGFISQLSCTPLPPPAPVPQSKNGIMYVPFGMPFKESNADGHNSFSLGRHIYRRTNQANATITPQILQQKKWIGGSRDASQRITNIRTNAVGLGSMNADGGPIAFKNIVDNNTAKNARQRARSGGYINRFKK